MAVLARRLTGERWARAASAITPPSPLLSARMMKPTYLIVTTITSAQMISDTVPITAAWLAAWPPTAMAESCMA